MMEPVERAATAIWERQRSKIGDPNGLNARLEWRDKLVPAKFWESYVDDVHAAFETLLSPSPKMLAAAWEVCNKNRDVRLQLAPGPAFKEALQAMIHAALSASGARP